jgi:hypothetical protein
MLLLGLLLLCATGAFVGLLIADNLSGGPDYQVMLLGNTIATMNSLAIFLSGLALALIFCLALAMTGLGSRIAGRRRALVRTARGPRAGAPARHAATTDAAAEEEVAPTVATPAGSPRRTHRHLFGH